MFKSREDVYHSKSFETQEEALVYIKNMNDALKKSGYMVMDMGVREVFEYQQTSAVAQALEHVPVGYAGTIAAKKEAASEQTETAAVDTVN